MLERDIEKKVCDYAKDRGILTYKFTSPSRTAVPDRLFIGPRGHMWFVEFKKQGLKPTAPQEREHQRLRQQRVEVWVVDSVESGKLMIDEKMVAWGL